MVFLLLLLQLGYNFLFKTNIVVVVYPACACASRGVIWLGLVSIYIYIGMFVDKKELNRTLAINSPFQTFAAGLVIQFIDWRYPQ